MSAIEIVRETAYGQGLALRLALDGPHAGRHLPVHAYRPGCGAAGRPVVMVMHGVTRFAKDYLDSWVGLAERFGFCLVVPEFSKADWPRSRTYNLGNLFAEDGTRLPPEASSFAVVERVFDAAAPVLGGSASSFSLYGHSAGAQFVHRYLFFVPQARVSRIVPANAGWYTLPDPARSYPYGLGGLGPDRDTLRAAFATEMTVLLGEADNDPDSPDLRHTPEAEAQGPHRLARGRHFIDAARARATELGLPCAWTSREVPMIGHSDRGMAPHAARILMEGRAPA